jgi:glutamine synthetase
VQLEGDEEYRGYPHIPDQAAINELVGHYFKLGIPVNIHALGDAAIDQAIEAISKAEDSSVEMDRRSNLIHLQFLQEDQLDALRELGRDKTLSAALGQETVDAFIKLKMRDWNDYTAHLSQWERDNTLDC